MDQTVAESPGVQLTLGIGLREGISFDNFLADGNAGLLYTLRSQGEPFVFLWGEAGSGKSHLLQAACHASGVAAAYLPLCEFVELGAGVLDGLEAMSLVALDDLHCVAGIAEWEEALFHLYNRIRDAGGRLLASANSGPLSLGIGLPDLTSRLSWGPVFRVEALDDEGKWKALQQRAAERGMHLGDEVASYLIKHFSRDSHALFDLLERLDRTSLQQQRRLTIPFVREVLNRRD